MNASEHDDWDLIYGGYPHCGDWQIMDWDMQTGLNRRMAERGWQSLRPSQVWHPCMGCRETFCNRRELCRLLRRGDPSLCFLLPEHGAELEALMDGERVFVVKRDGDWHGGPCV